MVHIGGLVVYGKDNDFNRLRVFPPDTLSNYPEFLRDGQDFYKNVGRPDLKEKYALIKAQQ